MILSPFNFCFKSCSERTSFVKLIIHTEIHIIELASTHFKPSHLLRLSLPFQTWSSSNSKWVLLVLGLCPLLSSTKLADDELEEFKSALHELREGSSSSSVWKDESSGSRAFEGSPIRGSIGNAFDLSPWRDQYLRGWQCTERDDGERRGKRWSLKFNVQHFTLDWPTN